MEFVTCGNTEFPVRELPEKLRVLNTVDPDSGDSLLVTEFKVRKAVWTRWYACEVNNHGLDVRSYLQKLWVCGWTFHLLVLENKEVKRKSVSWLLVLYSCILSALLLDTSDLS